MAARSFTVASRKPSAKYVLPPRDLKSPNMRRLAIGVVGLVVAAGVALILVGWLRPPGHTATTQAIYPVPQQEVWDTLTGFDRWSAWYPEVSGVTTVPERAGNRRLVITGEWGEVPTELTAWDPPHRLRTEMDQGTFSGSWSWDLTPVPEGTLVRVTEDGERRVRLFL